MSRICVKNIGKNVKESDLKDLFSARGEVTDVKVLRTKDGKSRRIAFVGFRTEVQAQEVQKYHHNTFIGQTRISIEIAKKVHDPSLEEAKLKHQKKFNPNAPKDNNVVDSSSSKKVKNTEVPVVMSKNKAEFLEVMKSRDNAHWGNDDGIRAAGTELSKPGSSKTKKMDMSDDEDEGADSDSDSDGDDINDFSKTVPAVDDKAKPTGPLSDADYLKSKFTKFSDSDSDESDDDDNGDESEEEIQKYKPTKKPTEKPTIESKPEPKPSTTEAPVQPVAASEVDNSGDITIVNNIETEEMEDSSRLFVKNLPFTCTEEEFRTLFEPFGVISEVHLPLDKEKKGKGFGFVQFMIPECATAALNELSGSSFQGRLLHITKAQRKLEATPAAEAGGKNSRLSSFQQKKEEERRKFANKIEGWNAAFVRSDAVVESLADKYNLSRADILDTTEGGGELAVRLAIGETQVIAENREYFLAHGVDIGALESVHSDKKASKRSTTTILVKNLPFDLVEDEVESMFARFGSVAAFLVPKSRTMALVDFVEPTEARAAYKGLAYRSYKHMPMYLEWAPLGVIDPDKASAAKKALQLAQQKKNGGAAASSGKSSGSSSSNGNSTAAVKEVEEDNQDEYSTLFIKNLNFITTEHNLKDHFTSMGIQGVRTISIQKKQKGQQILSQGYGFVEFKTHALAQEAMTRLNGCLIDSHALVVKPSDKRITIKPVVLKASSNSGGAAGSSSRSVLPPNSNNNKLIVRNVAFQATNQEIRSLFAAFGSVKRVRIPKKMGGEHRGFAFVDFSTSQEAATAMASLKDTHLYGRHLVLEWAQGDEEDEDESGGVLRTAGKGLEGLRKRARADEKVIAVENKRARDRKTVDEDEMGGGIGSDDI